eukprot:2273570-Alexandrium_andersonii.AAC.1
MFEAGLLPGDARERAGAVRMAGPLRDGAAARRRRGRSQRAVRSRSSARRSTPVAGLLPGGVQDLA